MSFLGGIGINPTSLLATAAFGPLGGVVSQFVGPMLSNFGQQLIQNLGKELNLPQPAIDAAQGQFAASVGDFGGAFQNANDAIEGLGKQMNASISDIANQQREFQKTLDKVLSDINQSDDVKEAKASRGKAPGWLMAMAKALGAKLDKLADKMEQQAEDMDGDKPSASAEFTVTTQQFSMLMNATSNGLKTVGEGLANMARKGQ